MMSTISAPHNETEEPDRFKIEITVSEKDLANNLTENIINTLKQTVDTPIHTVIVFSQIISLDSWKKIYKIFSTDIIPYMADNDITCNLIDPANIFYNSRSTTEDTIKSLLTTLYWNLVYEAHDSPQRFPLFCKPNDAYPIITTNEYERLRKMSNTVIYVSGEGI